MSDSEEVALHDEDYDSEQGYEPDEVDEPEGLADGDVIEDDVDEDAAPTKYKSNMRIVHPQDRMTSEVMSLYEMAECTSIRAQQIATYNNCMVATDLSDPIEMAKYELMQRKCPLVIRRKVGEVREGDEYVEYFEEWDPNEMIFACDYNTIA
jgi:DNA-directed RNA polymerase subunit K/omega